MQPLISPVDHESRHHSNRAEDDQNRSSENTPLLHRFPRRRSGDPERSTAVVVSMLVLALTSGVVIGVYLLILQNHAENVLPPVDEPLLLVSRTQWDPGARPLSDMPPLQASRVLVVQTDTPSCPGISECTALLRNMPVQSDITSNEKYLPYNFLVSSSGHTFEAIGWKRALSVMDDAPPTLVLAFIGNFTKTPPTREQLRGAKAFLTESVSLQHLHPSYCVFGKPTKHVPQHLFRSLHTFPQCKGEMPS